MVTVRLEQFQGPLELLLELIEQNKLSVTDVSLGIVTDQYLEAVRTMESHSLSDLADFVVVASRLLLIKSKALLPGLELTPEEEQEVASLKQALEEYRRFRDQVPYLRSRARAPVGIAARELWHERPAVFYPPRPFDAARAATLFGSVLATWERFVQPREQQVAERVVSIERKIQDIIARIQQQARTSLRSLAGASSKKIDIIVAFLALLFLFREKMVSLEQSQDGSDLIVSKSESILSDG